VAALNGTVALPEVHQVAVSVAENLHFDVLGLGDVALEKNLGPTERRRRFALRLFEPSAEFTGVPDDPHAAATAAEAGFDHQRESDALAVGSEFGGIVQCRVGAGNGGNADRVGQTFRRGLVAKHVEVVWRRADELDAGRLAGACQRRAFCQEPVTRMDGVDVLLPRDLDERGDVQIGADGLAAFRRPDEKGLVSLETVQ
jgi:hypothetical protein